MNTHTPAGYRALLRTGSWFHALEPALQDQLLALAHVRRLRSGQRLFARGDAPDGMYAIVDGAVRVGGLSETGKEAVLALVEPPHWFGEISLFDGQPRTHDAWAEGDVTLLHVPQQPLLALLDAQPVHWRALALLMTHKLRLTFMVMEETALLPASARLARRLVTMAEGYGDWKDRNRRMLHVPQEQLSLMLSLSRQTVNQILKQFEAQHAIALVRGGIEILDIARLRLLAQ
ncbi:Crp/Fnr family transcriptional regulator [Pseudoduganella ginsengisoli]|uniref:Cyclic nucleotide-binding domain-containing protein n=1 Tax=Pseudoduganella ginsengisoli TaxID=1462440 RepID=A0A6L6PYC7_9BURK|nr:Crp/Fnr family transcriptional regulator [Pseudoduganella ginsengisoli]MTW02613.1 cyclic nucleotide-binding domain-containing protein [Pseudoduganella ginsengisoli]